MASGYIVEKFRRLLERSITAYLIIKLRGRNYFSRSNVTSPGGAVVSLTTYGHRLKTVYLTIESIANGNVLPSRLLLWLDDEVAYSAPPNNLRRLIRRGLEIRLCRDLGPHKKYYPYVAGEEQLTLPLATADDDILYPRGWLEGLVKAWRDDPTSVHCYRARVVTLSSDGMAPYSEWPLCQSAIPSARHIATGCSGVIYPQSLLQSVKKSGPGFLNCCPRADDLWLHVQTIRAGFKIQQIGSCAMHFRTIPGSQKGSLMTQNVLASDGNDRQISATYTDIDRLIFDAEDQQPR
jgi:hypothetical protein